MSFNRRNEYKKYIAKQETQKREYIALGLSEEQIEKIQELDRQQFLSDMRFYMHNQSFDCVNDDFEQDERSPLLKKFFGLLVVYQEPIDKYLGLYIENDELVKAVKQLSPIQKEILKLLIDGCSVEEINKITRIPCRTIYYKKKQIKNKLLPSMKKLFPECFDKNEGANK
jgi:uncharacterized protein YlbG (UPF0298 family)